MEFEDAERRLAQEQSKLRGRKSSQQQAGNGRVLSAKAKREMEYRKAQQERLRMERERDLLQQEAQRQYMTKCDRALHIKPLSSSSASTRSLRLKPTSIHGEGDKIALPPSVLEFLMQGMTSHNDGDSGIKNASPWTFRIGIPNPEYQFPASPGLKVLKPLASSHSDAMDVDSDDDDDDENNDNAEEKVYLEELSYKYCSLTHGTVVEFTQEEGYVGLPASIAYSLLDQSRRRKDDATKIPVKRTVDPSREVSSVESEHQQQHDDMVDDEKTPGHLAWGAFDLPDVLVEITMVELPKGKRCVLVPTEAAIRNGFYSLKDVKMVLEQSLVRTRATLSVGDVVHTWHRGVKFDLMVASVTPATFHAISCINTDLEVDFEAPKSNAIEDSLASSQLQVGRSSGIASPAQPSGGRILSARPVEKPDHSSIKPDTATLKPVELIPEPPVDQKEGICTVQIQADGATGRRRFDAQTATVQDLFDFASTVVKLNVHHFALVTRFPRRVLELNDANAKSTLVAMNIQPGRELFIVERK